MVSSPSDEDNSKFTPAGCLLLVLSLGVIFGSALFMLRLEIPSLPWQVVIPAPVLAGAICFAIGSSILKVVGLGVLTKETKDSSGPSEDADQSSKDNQTKA